MIQSPTPKQSKLRMILTTLGLALAVGVLGFQIGCFVQKAKSNQEEVDRSMKRTLQDKAALDAEMKRLEADSKKLLEQGR